MSEPAEVEPVRLGECAAQNGLRIGFAELHAEKSLNALSLPMIRKLLPQLQRWASVPDVACVVLHGAGEKAFCAGGDVRAMFRAIREHPNALPSLPNLDFFSSEYRLDYLIHTFPKPILVWGSGITMGGGLGLLAGASHRVVTETSRVAMPEITIGLFPDVGASYFLSRMPRAFGLFLALSGASIHGADLQQIGLADHLLRASDRSDVFKALEHVPWTSDTTENAQLLTRLLERFAARAKPPASVLEAHRDTLEALASLPSLSEVYAAITGYAGRDPWLSRAAKALALGSPTTAGLIWELQARGQHMTLAEVFRMELVVALQCCAHPDFSEGVRALLIDKDNAPKWSPSTFAELEQGYVAEHFVAPPWPTGVHPLADLA